MQPMLNYLEQKYGVLSKLPNSRLDVLNELKDNFPGQLGSLDALDFFCHTHPWYEPCTLVELATEGVDQTLYNPAAIKVKITDKLKEMIKPLVLPDEHLYFRVVHGRFYVYYQSLCGNRFLCNLKEQA